MIFSFNIATGQEAYYNGEKIIDEVEYGSMKAILVERFPAEKIILAGADFEKNAYIAAARSVDFDGEYVAVTGSCGTYLLDMDMNIALGVKEAGRLVSIGDYICIANENSIKVFSKEYASIVCQHEFGTNNRITGMDTSGDFIEVIVEKINPETGKNTVEHMKFLITEEGFVLS